MNNQKRLYRSENDVMLGGVCAGLGDYFDIDPTIVRLIFVVLFLSGSVGFWLYLVMWIVVPQASAAGSSTAHVVEGHTVVDETPAAEAPAEEPIPLDLDDVE